MNYRIRLNVCFVLMIALMVSILTACGTTENDTSHKPTDPAETLIADPQLDVGTKTYNGAEFTILTTKHNEWEHAVKEPTSEIVSDAVYNRNLAVETLLNIDIEYRVELGNWDERNEYCNLIRSDVMANDQAYDLITGVTVCMMPMTLEKIFLSTDELEYVNIDNPWWVNNMMEDIGLHGKLYGLLGDACLNLYTDLAVFYFNANLLAEYKLENPYEIVRAGNWTVDKLSEMVQAVSLDIDGNGKIEANSDRFGMMGFTTVNRSFITGAEIQIIPIVDGEPIVADLSERLISLYEKLYRLCVESDSYLTILGDYTKNATHFLNGQVLFIDNWLRAMDMFREMEDDFGIIPYPKFEAVQQSYHTQIGTSTSMLFVTITAKNAELSSKVEESLSYYGWKDVVPAYYEVALKEKYARDPDVQEMLDIIRSSAQMNFTFAYSTMFSPYPNLLTEFRDKSENDNITSIYTSNKAQWETQLNKIIETLANISR